MVLRLEGEFSFEVGNEKFTLQPGDSLFAAPRMVPHVWAHVGTHPGTLLLALQPAVLFEKCGIKYYFKTPARRNWMLHINKA